MAKGGGNTTGSPKGRSATGSTTRTKPFIATPGREEARAVQRDLPQWAVDGLMARQDRATAHPPVGSATVQPQGPARVMSTNWVEQNQQARLAQAVARSTAGVPMPAPGGTVMQVGPTSSEAQAIEAMRVRFAAALGLSSEQGHEAGTETRRGRLRAWTAELPGKAKSRDQEREP